VSQTAKLVAPPPAPLIRDAALTDLPALMAIEAHSFDDDRLSRRSFHHLLTRGHAVNLVIESTGRVVGYAVILLHKGTSLARLYSIAVDPKIRGQGLGSLLLAEAERRAAAEGRAFMRLEVRPDNASAVARYRASGYREFGVLSDYYADHSEALRMEKALTLGEAPALRHMPFYPQTLDFTCGPACLMMAMKALDHRLRLDRRLELRLWREATTIFMAAGHGGCGPYGLALAAQRRGFQAQIHVDDDDALFIDSVRSAEKKAVIRLVREDYREEAKRAGIRVTKRGLSVDALVRHLKQGAVPIVLISCYRLTGEKVPHWVVMTGYDRRFVYFNDPFTSEKRFRRPADCMNIPVPRADFGRMARWGQARLRAAIVLTESPDQA